MMILSRGSSDITQTLLQSTETLLRLTVKEDVFSVSYVFLTECIISQRAILQNIAQLPHIGLYVEKF